MAHVLNKSQANFFNYSSLVRSKLTLTQQTIDFHVLKVKQWVERLSQANTYTVTIMFFKIYTRQSTHCKESSPRYFSGFMLLPKPSSSLSLLKQSTWCHRSWGPYILDRCESKSFFDILTASWKVKRTYLLYCYFMQKKYLHVFSFFRPTCKIVHLYFGPP